jgi:hypothetical protein
LCEIHGLFNRCVWGGCYDEWGRRTAETEKRYMIQSRSDRDDVETHRLATNALILDVAKETITVKNRRAAQRLTMQQKRQRNMAGA